MAETNKKLESSDSKLDDLSRNLDVMMEKLFSSRDGILGSAPAEIQHSEGSSRRARIMDNHGNATGRFNHHNPAIKVKSPYFKERDPRSWLLELLAGSQLHAVFHISQLKHHVGPTISPQLQPLACYDEGHVLIQPVAILQWKMFKVDNGVSVKVLIQWENFGPDNATWED